MSGVQTESETMAHDESMATDDAQGAPSTSSQTAVDAPVPAEPQPARPRLVISHDKYMQLQSFVVFHLAEVERETGKGLDHDDLVDWYLESREAEIQSVEQLEYEKELITKVIRKLKRVSAHPVMCSLRTILLMGRASRTITSWKSLATFRTRYLRSTRSARQKARGMPGSTTWSTRRLT